MGELVEDRRGEEGIQGNAVSKGDRSLRWRCSVMGVSTCTCTSGIWLGDCRGRGKELLKASEPLVAELTHSFPVGSCQLYTHFVCTHAAGYGWRIHNLWLVVLKFMIMNFRWAFTAAWQVVLCYPTSFTGLSQFPPFSQTFNISSPCPILSWLSCFLFYWETGS